MQHRGILFTESSRVRRDEGITKRRKCWGLRLQHPLIHVKPMTEMRFAQRLCDLLSSLTLYRRLPMLRDLKDAGELIVGVEKSASEAQTSRKTTREQPHR